MATPTPAPCDSPNVVIRNSWPKLLPMAFVILNAVKNLSSSCL
jgi:hypothetical protein